LLKIRKDSIS